MKILDTPRETVFDTIVARAQGYFPGTTMAAISLIDADRQWFKASLGLDVSETPRAMAFCSHTILRPEPFVVEDATKDHRFSANPLVTAAPAIRFYIGARLAGGLGALCVIGTEPRKATRQECASLVRLAAFVDIHLSVHATKAKLTRL